MRLPKQVVRIANAITNVALLAGIPRPPYARRNALVIETVGYRRVSGAASPSGISTTAVASSSSSSMASMPNGSGTRLQTTGVSGFTSAEHDGRPACGLWMEIQRPTFAA